MKQIDGGWGGSGRLLQRLGGGRLGPDGTGQRQRTRAENRPETLRTTLGLVRQREADVVGVPHGEDVDLGGQWDHRVNIIARGDVVPASRLPEEVAGGASAIADGGSDAVEHDGGGGVLQCHEGADRERIACVEAADLGEDFGVVGDGVDERQVLAKRPVLYVHLGVLHRLGDAVGDQGGAAVDGDLIAGGGVEGAIQHLVIQGALDAPLLTTGRGEAATVGIVDVRGDRHQRRCRGTPTSDSAKLVLTRTVREDESVPR